MISALEAGVSAAPGRAATPAGLATKCRFTKTSSNPKAWGEHSATLTLAGQNLRVEGLSKYQARRLKQRYENLLAACQPAGLSFGKIRCLRQTIAPTPAERFSVNGIYTPRLICSPERIAVHGFAFRATTDLTPKPPISRLYTDNERLTTEPVILENYLRILTAFSALAQGGILLHCAVVVVDGQAHLFLGRSGAGKTTISRSALAAGFDVLSDDAAVVLPAATKEGEYRVVHVPFFGELGGRPHCKHHELPVGRVFWLKKGPRLESLRLSQANQLVRLLVCCPFANSDPFRMDTLLGHAGSLLQSHSMEVLTLPRGESFRNVHRLLAKESHK